MSNRLGRNPFDKKKKEAPLPKPIVGEMIDIPEADHDATQAPVGMLTRLLVDLPADAYVFSLKARLLARSILK